KGDYAAAIEQLEQAAKIAPDPRLLDTIGIAYQYQKDYHKAIEEHRAALALDPKSAGTTDDLAPPLPASRKSPGALSPWLEAIEAEREFAYSYNHLAVVELRRGNRSEAIEALRQGHARLPEDSVLSLQLAWLLATSQDEHFRNPPDAIKLASSVCARNGYQDAESLDVLAASYASAGNFDRAVEMAKRAELLASTDELKKRVHSHLNLYLKKQPYYE